MEIFLIQGGRGLEVYLDVIWALNFLFDSLLLYLTAIILKRQVRLYRILLGGFIGSIIIVLSVIPIQFYIGHPLIKLLFSILMVLTTFGYKKVHYFLRGLMTFYLITFLIGGALIGAHYFIRFDNKLTSAVFLSSVKGFGDPISWFFVLIGFPIAWHFSKRNIEGIEMTKIQYESLIEVMIEIAGVTYRFKGLIDSGNQLYEPITKIPVMLVSIKGRIKEFPDSLVKIAENSEEIILGNYDVSAEWNSRLRIIPYKVVGQDHQLIIAIKPDKITLEKNGQFIAVEKGLISFSMQQFAGDDAFQCIVHPKMLTSTKSAEVAI